MRRLPLVPAGCTLMPGGLAAQQARARTIAPDVAAVTRSDRELLVRFDAGVDERAVAELVRAEQSCCSFFRIESADRELRVSIDDPRRRDALDAVTRFFTEDR